VNHRDEASKYCDLVRSEFNAPLHCHEKEKEAISWCCKDIKTFSERHMFYPDFEVIPTPGTYLICILI
jgi:hypothetical protein